MTPRRQLANGEMICPECGGSGENTWRHQCELCQGMGSVLNPPQLYTPKVVACTCGDQVIWCRASEATIVAVNADPDPDGLVTLDIRPGHMVPSAHIHRAAGPPEGAVTYSVHRCPNR